MSRFVLAWELGGGYGHLSALVPLARDLRSRGHQVTCILRDVSRSAPLFGPLGVPVLQAPLWLPKFQGAQRPVNYAEMLYHFGYLDRQGLLSMVKAWLELYRLTQPVLVLLDHAPTALLAARVAGVPAALYGTGFASPPRTSPMPSMRPWMETAADRLLAAEERVLRIINAVIGRLGGRVLETLADLFDVSEDFLCTFPELDHYGPRPASRYWGPCVAPVGGEPPGWPPEEAPRLLAYLKPSYPQFEAVLTCLREGPGTTLIHAPGVPREIVQRYSLARTLFSREPFDMAEGLRQADLLVCHAGHGACALALLAGRPLMLLPTHVEQYLLARRLVDLGVAVAVKPDEKTRQPGPALDEILSDPRFRSRADDFAARHSDFDAAAAIAHIALRCDDLIAPRP